MSLHCDPVPTFRSKPNVSVWYGNGMLIVLTIRQVGSMNVSAHCWTVLDHGHLREAPSDTLMLNALYN
jgi:hypothetical protein